MLAHCSARRAVNVLHRPCGNVQPRSFQRRTFVNIETFTNGFLDLATALPLPSSFPPYSTTIIICTVVSRLIWTVPFSIWAKQRQRRAEEEVMPIVNSLKPGVSKLVLTEMQKIGVRGTKEQIQAAHGKRVKQLLTTRQKQLFSEYRCSPGFTMAIPIITQVPLFMGFSIVLNRLSQAPTPFDSESFLTLSTLAHVDPTATLPIALGLITLANVESSRWFMTDAQRERQEKVQKWKEDRVARGETVIEPQKIIKSALRLISVGRIVVATMVPGGVILYWVTSATFGLVQTWIMDYLELQRKRKLALAPALSKKIPAAKQ
ncbi:60Kd inner membrane protein-domain-containing protein [Suillus discolor]|uniref:60Kd inner membrane protein-domain-containing protein n=1 Tax=Suillus discolor TaxID=1912936 RepID=A0A9P7FEN9_9AGAM|nr:60Kd inner membrane protein-domain-containing protein [Suillus discolor]KAG2116100.1 60Kd inner membrane protein-domain-containing protein [Suillus discolor]